MKKFILIFILMIWFPVCCFAADQDSKELVDELFEDYTEFYGDILEDGLEKTSFTELVPRLNIKRIFGQLIDGEIEISIPELLGLLIKYILGEVYRCMKFMAIVLAAAILSSYLMGLQEGLGESGVTGTAYYVCYVVIAGISAGAFYNTAEGISSAINDIAVLMEIMVPVVITTLVAGGAMISASIFEPVLLAIVEIAVKVIQTAFIPLVMIMAAMNIINGLSDKLKIKKLIQFLNHLVKWGLGTMLTVFVSTAGIQSIAASGADGLSVKLTKFAASHLIPVVGGILSESVETVMNCSVLIKNSVGIMGILCLAVISAVPLLKTAAILMVFRLTAAVAEPVAEPKIIGCLSELANSISVLFSMLAATIVMFVIIFTIVINAGNTAILLGR